MQVYQRLSSGIIIRQDIRNSVRFIMFETEYEDWKYATNGGTAFIINLNGSHYGITCKHVLTDFSYHQLAITNKRNGNTIAGINSVYYPSCPIHHAKETDIEDILIVKFSEDCNNSFFNDTSYVIDCNTIGTSDKNDRLLIEGTLKAQSSIGEKTIRPQFCTLELNDNGTTNDPILRKASGQFKNNIEFDNITGISGSPVFNITKKVLCGMVVRGGINDEKYCNILYIDIYDIEKFLRAVHEGCSETNYKKIIVKHA